MLSTDEPSSERSITDAPKKDRSTVLRDRILIACGPFVGCQYLIFLTASHLFPPLKPSLTAIETAEHYRNNLAGTRAGVFLLIISSLIWPFWGLGINNQLRRIPNVNPHILNIQIASGCASGTLTIVLAVMFGATIYRLDRNPEITQALSDLSLLLYNMINAAYVPQQVAIVLACLSDPRPKPLIPKWTSWLSLACMCVWITAYAGHIAHSGPFAWDGAVAFWTVIAVYFIQCSLLLFHLMKVAGEIDEDAPGEKEA
ncbi:hypothetical protein N7454_010731 [Penicillium verhagenii]|nr:hypothetical protein N7454_010731 [Penicillium verhagenii]